MIGHIGFYVSDLQKSDLFYRPLLAIFGYEVIFEVPQCVAYGVNGKPCIEIYTGKPPTSPLHLALNAMDAKMVEVFHEKGLSLGATCHGKPGLRSYFPGYYAAFILDLNGHNLEALYWQP